MSSCRLGPKYALVFYLFSLFFLCQLFFRRWDVLDSFSPSTKESNQLEVTRLTSSNKPEPVYLSSLIRHIEPALPFILSSFERHEHHIHRALASSLLPPIPVESVAVLGSLPGTSAWMTRGRVGHFFKSLWAVSSFRTSAERPTTKNRPHNIKVKTIASYLNFCELTVPRFQQFVPIHELAISQRGIYNKSWQLYMLTRISRLLGSFTNIIT